MSSDHLSVAEGRVLGVLVEKQRTVPDTYPLTLNALVAGCNQKSSRDPVLALGDTEVQAALDGLKRRSLVVETSGGRVMRYAHNAERALAVPSQSVAILAVLLLRGPQTAGELRINTERMHRFADISAVEAFLHELAQRPSGALVVELPRTPGTRETRWAQLLTGPVATEGGESETRAPRAEAAPGEGPASDTLASEVAALRDEVAALRSEVARLRAAMPSPSLDRDDASRAEPA
ncbi:MAG: YceH family protein [Rudaea sp.]